MTKDQWKTILKVIHGEELKELPIGFIIDSPWLPGWYGISNLDYYTSENHWFDSNKKAIDTFPDVIFLPGFWSEFGMCTEPSAFGAKQTWEINSLPYAHKIISDLDETDKLKKPDVTKDGLLPFMLTRLVHNENRMKEIGHLNKMAIARGPMNIASFLLGTTELMMGIKMKPEKAHKLLNIISEFVIDWLELQMETFETIDGIFLLDDLIGFLGEEDFKEFALPYFQKIYGQFNVSLKFLHNDAKGLITAKYLEEIGVNLFNFSFEHSIKEIRELTNNNVALLGNIPPRDILAQGSPVKVENTVKVALEQLKSMNKLIFSCGGGMPPDVSTENINTFIEVTKQYSKH